MPKYFFCMQSHLLEAEGWADYWFSKIFFYNEAKCLLKQESWQMELNIMTTLKEI